MSARIACFIETTACFYSLVCDALLWEEKSSNLRAGVFEEWGQYSALQVV